MKFEYKSKRYWYNLVFTFVIIILLLYIYFKKIIVFDLNDLNAVFWYLVLGFFSIAMTKDFFHMVFGGLKIEIRNQNLIVEYHNGFYKRKQNFKLQKMDDLEILHVVRNGYSWKWGGLIFNDTDKEIFQFSYNGKKVIVGKKMSEFDAVELMNEIIKIKN